MICPLPKESLARLDVERSRKYIENQKTVSRAKVSSPKIFTQNDILFSCSIIFGFGLTTGITIMRLIA